MAITSSDATIVGYKPSNSVIHVIIFIYFLLFFALLFIARWELMELIEVKCSHLLINDMSIEKWPMTDKISIDWRSISFFSVSIEWVFCHHKNKQVYSYLVSQTVDGEIRYIFDIEHDVWQSKFRLRNFEILARNRNKSLHYLHHVVRRLVKGFQPFMSKLNNS